MNDHTPSRRYPTPTIMIYPIGYQLPERCLCCGFSFDFSYLSDVDLAFNDVAFFHPTNLIHVMFSYSGQPPYPYHPANVLGDGLNDGSVVR